MKPKEMIFFPEPKAFSTVRRILKHSFSSHLCCSLKMFKYMHMHYVFIVCIFPRRLI